MSGLEYHSVMTVGAAIPGAMAAIDLAIPSLQSQIDALLRYSPGALSYAAMLAAAEQMVLDLKAAIAAGLQPPSIDAQIAAVLAQLATLQARLQLITNFTGLMATAGMHAWSYTGQANQFGPGFATATQNGLPGGQATDQVVAVIFAANAGATASAMAGVFVGISG